MKRRKNIRRNKMPLQKTFKEARFLSRIGQTATNILIFQSAHKPILQQGTDAVLIFPDDNHYALTQSKIDAKPNPYLRAEILNNLRQHRFAEVINYSKSGAIQYIIIMICRESTMR